MGLEIFFVLFFYLSGQVFKTCVEVPNAPLQSTANYLPHISYCDWSGCATVMGKAAAKSSGLMCPDTVLIEQHLW